jgi:hypothetical protein
MIKQNHISYKDSAARVVFKKNVYYRYIFNDYKEEYEHLMKSGLYTELTKKGYLIKHVETEIDSNDPKIYKLLVPYQIPFKSYPFEWSFLQWKRAILSYLEINKIALKHGMILKDATPYNFCHLVGKAVLFDTSSFIFFNKNDNWIAYKQFCEEFFGPILLMYYNGHEWSNLTMSKMGNLGLEFISRQLPFKSWFNFNIFTHIHWHSRYVNKSLAKNKYKKNGFTIEKIGIINDMIHHTINRWEILPNLHSVWSGYYENDIEEKGYLQDKVDTIREWLKLTKPKTVLDIGANTGNFSFIAREFSEQVIAIEPDNVCVDDIEKHIRKNNLENIFAVVLDITKPSPTLGLMNKETENINKRLKSEMVFGLALTHHLYITNKLSFQQIAELFFELSSENVIIEFIEKDDSKVALLTENLQLKTELYNEENFLKAFERFFLEISRKKMKDSARILYLLKRKSDAPKH